MKSEVPRFGNKFENTLSAKRSFQDMYKIARFLHKSLIAEEPSINDKRQNEIAPPPPPLSRPKLPSNAPPEYDYSLRDALCDIRMLWNMAKSPLGFVVTLGLLHL